MRMRHWNITNDYGEVKMEVRVGPRGEETSELVGVKADESGEERAHGFAGGICAERPARLSRASTRSTADSKRQKVV